MSEAHEIELNIHDREIARLLAEKGNLSATALSRETNTDLRLVDRSILKLLHNGLITVDTYDVCSITTKGRDRVPRISAASFREKINRVV